MINNELAEVKAWLEARVRAWSSVECFAASRVDEDTLYDNANSEAWRTIRQLADNKATNHNATLKHLLET